MQQEAGGGFAWGGVLPGPAGPAAAVGFLQPRRSLKGGKTCCMAAGPGGGSLLMEVLLVRIMNTAPLRD